MNQIIDRNMTIYVFVMVSLLIIATSYYLVIGFIKWHEGKPLRDGLTISAEILCITLCLLQIPNVLHGHYLQAIQALMIYAFSLMFLLLDCSNHWLPLEFTAPFCVVGVLLSPSDFTTALLHLSMMAGLLTAYRLLLRRIYLADVLGKGDIWMMSGFAAFFSFIGAAVVLVCGLLAMLATGRLFRKSRLPLAPFVLPFSTLLYLIHSNVPLFWRLL